MRNGVRNEPSAYMLKLCSAPEAMTHHTVGIESTRRYGDPSRRLSPIGVASLMPRRGSRIHSAAIAHRTPGMPAM